MLQINEKWRINADRYNWILENKRIVKATGVEMWDAYSYHGSLAQAINKFCSSVLKDNINATNVDLESFLKVIEDLKQTINAACENIDQDALKEFVMNKKPKADTSY